MFTVFYVVKNGLDLSSHVFAEAFAKAEGRQFAQPVQGGVVHGFCNVESQIEAGMISTSEDHHDLPSPMLSFGYLQLGILLKQQLRLY